MLIIKLWNGDFKKCFFTIKRCIIYQLVYRNEIS